MSAPPNVGIKRIPVGLAEFLERAPARVVSLRPAVSTTDQWVVTNAGCRDASFSGGAVSNGVAGVEVLTDGEA